MAKGKELELYNASPARKVSNCQSQQRASKLVKASKGSIRVRNNAQHGLATTERAITVEMTALYAKIGSHWSPVDGNAADQYGLGYLE